MAPNKAPANQRLLACQMCWLPLWGSWHRTAMTERVVLKIPSPRAAVKASRYDLISHILHPVSDSFSQLPDTIETVPRRCGRSAPSEPFPLRKEVTSMDNENKWEYDYSSEHSQTGETGYPNVGSSGMNTANTAGTYGEAAQAAPQAEPNSESDGGAVPPPEGPRYQTAQGSPKQPPKKRRRKNGNIARSAVALVLAAAMGFVGGFVGARVGNTGGKVVIQQVAPSSTSSSDSGSASAVNTASGMTTAQVSEMVSPSVVVITTEQVVYSQWSWYGQSQVESGAGSGVVISSDGYILTCAHVVSGASNITVTIGDTDCPATVVGEDDTSDVAVLKIDATDLTPATVGNSDSLAVGESVLAVGNPLGELGGTVTSGIVSALNRSVTIRGTSSTNTMSLIQMDASVSPGNSGGGLFNMNGELIGLVNAKSSSSDAEGLGFAIPINDAIKVAQDLLENGYVSGRPYMGITYLAVTDAQTAAQLNVNAYGVYVLDVVQGGPADKAGLKTGDRIVSIDGTEIAQKDDLGTLIQQHAAGDTLSITVAREGQMQTVSLTLGEKNAQTQQAQKNS